MQRRHGDFVCAWLDCESTQRVVFDILDVIAKGVRLFKVLDLMKWVITGLI